MVRGGYRLDFWNKGDKGLSEGEKKSAQMIIKRERLHKRRWGRGPKGI